MSQADALTLLSKKLGEHDDSDSAVELVVALEFMPLAIVQAAAYISQRASPSLVRRYIDAFRKSDRKRASLLKLEGGHLRRDGSCVPSGVSVQSFRSGSMRTGPRAWHSFHLRSRQRSRSQKSKSR